MRRRPVLATFFDIKRAYDTVWHKKLLSKLYLIGVSKNMYNFFQSYLYNRIIRVAIGLELSKPYSLEMGIPQGSIVAPTAFSVMIGDIHKLKLYNASVSLYADDLAMWSTSKYRRTDTKAFHNNEMANFQKNVDFVVRYMETNGFALAPEKTVFMVFSSAPVKENINIQIYNTPINQSKKVKYLGVILDKKFTFQAHIEHLIKKTRKNLYLIKILKRENGLGDLSLLRPLFTSLIRSRLTYGQEIFHSAPITYLQKLQSTETSILKSLLDIPKTANPLLVYREIGLKPLSLVRKFQTSKSIFRLGATENDIDEELDLKFNDKNTATARANIDKRPLIYRKGTSVINYVQDLVDTADVGDLTVEMIPQCRFHCSPWEDVNYDINTTLGDYNKTSHLNILTTMTKEKIDELKDYVCIYTDGSIQNNGAAGCAFALPEFDIVKHFRLNSGISIYSAEIFAIEKAMSFAMKRVKHDKVCIFTDSKSVLQALQNRNCNRFDSISNILNSMRDLMHKGKTVLLQWIPSHVGLKGNDMADKAAKEASLNLSLPIHDMGHTLSEVSAKLKSASDQQWLEEFKTVAKPLAWCNPEMIKVPSFKAPPKFSQVFLRLRCNSTKFDIYQNMCCCSEFPITVTHLFTCKSLYNQLLLTRTFCSRENIPFTYSGIMSFNEKLGWEPARTFIHEIVNSDIGHLL